MSVDRPIEALVTQEYPEPVAQSRQPRPHEAQTSMPADMGPFSVLLCLWYLKFASPDERSGTSPVMQPCSRQHAGTSAHLNRARVG